MYVSNQSSSITIYVTNLLTNCCVCAAISKQGCGGVKVSTAATQEDEAVGKE